ncbi:MAG TPA: Ig-like domain-containing protein [Pantanalinema sp.]
MAVSPTSATINALPPSGPGAPGYVTTVQLFATVTMSDGSTHGRVTWSSSDPARVRVAPDGTVQAPSTATAGTATVTATAQGTSLTASALITVTTDGDLFIIVE